MKTSLCTLLLGWLTTTVCADDAPPKVEVTPEHVKSALGKVETLTNQTFKSLGVPKRF